MTVMSKQNACTSTCFNKLSPYSRPENDEMYNYIEITEYLLTIRPEPRVKTVTRGQNTERWLVIETVRSGDKNLKLPMRKSLFSYVPPFIIFGNQTNGAKLPPEITKHLLWWRSSSATPRIVISTVKKSGFKTVNKATANWCGTWCSNRIYSKLKSTKVFSKVSCFPSCMELGNKIALWTNFRKMRRKHGSVHFDYMPFSFVLPDERNDLKNFMRKKGGIWIVKPPASCAGTGIKVVSRIQEIPEYNPFVVQRYISRPHLLDGIKFDIRLYVLLTSIDPLRIYLYKEGLVRLATVAYARNVNTLSNRFMHLTNTSVNKYSPYFEPNDDPNECRGNIWSIKCLWRYLSCVEDVDTVQIWSKIKDIAVKTIISAESALFNAWKKTSMSSYNFYQLFGFDVLLDGEDRPWLLEVNNYPSMEPDTPLCKLVKEELTKDYLNLVGFHVPDLLTSDELKTLNMIYKENGVCYNRRLYSKAPVWKEKQKQYIHSKMTSRNEYLKSILRNLTPDDVRVLIRHEDEANQIGNFERIFPTHNTYRYLPFLGKIRYYNLLLDAWEREYGCDRSTGIERLRKLCKRKYHLS